MLGGRRSLLGIRMKLKELILFYRDPNTVGLVQRFLLCSKDLIA